MNVIGLLCFHDLHNHECSHDHGPEVKHEHKEHENSENKHKHKEHKHKEHKHKEHKHKEKDHKPHTHKDGSSCSHDHSHDKSNKHEHKEHSIKKEKHKHDHDEEHGLTKTSHHEHSSDCSHDHGHDHKHEHNHDHHHNENIYGVFLHILADALGSLGVIISSLLIKYFGWYIADPICSIAISILIFISVIPLIRSSAETLLLKSPVRITLHYDKIMAKLSKLGKVESLVAWEIMKGKPVCSV